MRANYSTPRISAGMKVEDNENYPLKNNIDTAIVGELTKTVTACSAVIVTGLSVPRTRFNLMRHGIIDSTFVDINPEIARLSNALCDDIINHPHHRFIDAGITSVLNDHVMWKLLPKQYNIFPNQDKALMFDATAARTTSFEKSFNLLQERVFNLFGTTVELVEKVNFIKSDEELAFHRTFSKTPNLVKAKEIITELHGGTLKTLKLFNYCGKSVSMLSGGIVYKELR